MTGYSTRQAARKLGISMATINRYVASKKIPLTALTRVGGVKVRLWSSEDIERIRTILRTFPNGRRTRHRKQKPQFKKKSKH